MNRTMRGQSGRLATAAVLMAAWLSADGVRAAPVVDGSLADWGIIVPTTGNLLDTTTLGVPLANNVPWTPGPHGTFPAGYPSTLKTPGLTFSYTYMLEDTDTEAYVEPQSGGQPFDLEFMGVAYDQATNTLYIAIASGQRPDQGKAVFEPGDIQITTSKGKFGVEVGGGAGNGEPSYAGDTIDRPAITEGAPGTTYSSTLNNGNTNGWTFHTTGQTAGSIWKTTGTNDGWLLDFLPTQVPTPPYLQAQIDPAQVASGSNTKVGEANYIFTRNGIGGNDGGEHSVIELSIDLDDLGLNGINGISSIRWQPGCANDILDVDPVPVPGALVMLATCLVPAGAFVRRWRKVAAS